MFVRQFVEPNGTTYDNVQKVDDNDMIQVNTYIFNMFDYNNNTFTAWKKYINSNNIL